jgi:glutathionyl-hydroquinone reductase
VQYPLRPLLEPRGLTDQRVPIMRVGVLIDGKWTEDDETYRKGGAFIRATTAFRAFVAADSNAAFPAEAGRYHLYVARPCPWCHRTMIFRALKKLEDVVSMSMVEPLLLLEEGWKFATPDPSPARVSCMSYTPKPTIITPGASACRYCGTRKPAPSSATNQAAKFA